MSLAERAARLIPAGTQTYSKRRDQFPSNAPSHIQRGFGAHVLGDDGRWYIDWTMGLGAISLGYRDPDVDAAVLRQLNEGTIFGLAHPIELELAEELAPLMPWPDPMFRYGKNGSDATSAAVRVARAIRNDRDRAIVSFGYHGWQDWSCPNPTGIPEDIRRWTYEPQKRKFPWSPADYAAIIVEPDALPTETLRHFREACDSSGTLLIFDEVLTGFRYPGYTYAAYSKVTPDLVCLGKAIANGFPLSVVSGPRKYMEIFGGGIGYSTTFGGDTLSLAAALATVRKYQRAPVIERLWKVGRAVQDHWNAESARLGLDMPCVGDSPRSVIRYPNLSQKTLVMERMFEGGIMFTVGFTASYAHSDEDIECTNIAVTEALIAVAAGASIQGEPVVAAYRR